MLTGGLTIEDLQSGLSKLRNRVIGRVFKELNLIEQWGSGFQRMQESCQQGGFSDPEFEELGYHFRVTFSLLRQDVVIDTPVDSKIFACLTQHEDQGGASVSDLVKIGRIVAVGKSTYDPQKRYLLAKDP